MNHFVSGVDLDDEKSFDPALFDVTRIPVNDFANQITLDDFEIFKRITPEEVIFRNFKKWISGNTFSTHFSVWKWLSKIFKSSGFYNDQKVSIEWVSTRVYGF